MEYILEDISKSLDECIEFIGTKKRKVREKSYESERIINCEYMFQTSKLIIPDDIINMLLDQQQNKSSLTVWYNDGGCSQEFFGTFTKGLLFINLSI